ncbi:hypothetical protein ACFV42_23170 [Streptomyces solisilvae]|uniref:hypothetical protein n=1 Tax=Streptomyces malaysiensis TaxID=92644 RepID=UPI003691021A
MIVMARGRGGNSTNPRKGRDSKKKKSGKKMGSGRPFAARGSAFSYSPRGR